MNWTETVACERRNGMPDIPNMITNSNTVTMYPTKVHHRPWDGVAGIVTHVPGAQASRVAVRNRSLAGATRASTAMGRSWVQLVRRSEASCRPTTDPAGTASQVHPFGPTGPETSDDLAQSVRHSPPGNAFGHLGRDGVTRL
jgi:hypothetical protein